MALIPYFNELADRGQVHFAIVISQPGKFIKNGLRVFKIFRLYKLSQHFHAVR
jgi:hypothetical protein